MKKRHKNLSPDEARRALYIDFEGSKDRPPILLGRTRWSKPSRVWQVITDPAFAPLADAEELPLLSLSDGIDQLLRMAEKKERLIVAWSIHELDVVREYCPEHYERFEDRFVNAKLLASRWRTNCYGGDKPPTKDLATYSSSVGYQVPPEAGTGEVGTTIKVLSKALESGRNYDKLTANQKRRWTNLRDHNRHDCAGMRTICLKAARELEFAHEIALQIGL